MNENVTKTFKNPALVGLVAFAAGAALGYFLGKKEGSPQYQVIPAVTEFDPEAVHEYLEGSEDIPEEIIKGETFAEQLLRAKKDAEIVEIIEEGPEPEPVVTSIFPDTIPNWNYDHELQGRGPDVPYILHKDEFYNNENDWSQITITYYSGDDIMVDEDDTPIYNYHDTVGDLKFGHGSGDPNVLYVRNEKLRCEYEILNDPAKYSEEVLGLTIEPNDRVKGLKHSNDHVRRFPRE